MGFVKSNISLLGLFLIVISLLQQDTFLFEKRINRKVGHFNLVDENSKLETEKENFSTPSITVAMGYLTIPKLKLNLPWYPLNDSRNHVSQNIQYIASNLPSVKNGNFILAAHSGNSKVSYFRNLHFLELGDIIFVTYQNKTYSYEVIDFYEVLKSKLEIRRPTNETTLTLVTCVTLTNKRYLVVAKQI